MTALLIILGLMAAFLTALVTLFTAGTVPAGIAFVIVLAVTIGGVIISSALKKLIVAGLAILVLATLGFGSYSGYQLYGLRNFGVSGETSGSLIRSGQLEAALEFIRNNTVAYITLDIGANDLLGHIGSSDCAANFAAPACQARLANVLAAYEPNLDRIFADLRDAAPDATIIFLQTYNPFSLGFGASVALEADSNEITRQLNATAVGAASRHDILIADGFGPMQGTTAATTHMLDAPPDIHPLAIGYDILAGALVDALP